MSPMIIATSCPIISIDNQRRRPPRHSWRQTAQLARSESATCRGLHRPPRLDALADAELVHDPVYVVRIVRDAEALLDRRREAHRGMVQRVQLVVERAQLVGRFVDAQA